MSSAIVVDDLRSAYRGALIVASHDLPFLRGVGITRWLRLKGRLTEIDPP